MTVWSALFPDLMPHLPGCPRLVAAHELKRAAQALFEGSRAWKVTLAPIAVIASQDTVPVVPTDAEQDLVRVEDAWYDGKLLDPITAAKAEMDFGCDWQSQTGTPAAYLQETPGQLRLVPIPDADAVTGLTARISVKPSETATGVPDELAVKHRDTLIMGAKGKLMLYRDKPWTDIEMGAAMASAFSDQIGKANLDAARSFGRSRVVSRPSWC